MIHTDIAGGHVKMGAETGITQPQVKGLLEPLEAGRGRKDPPLEPSEVAWP